MKTVHLNIQGMSCEACVASAAQALRSVAGVRNVSVDLARGRVSVEHGDEVAVHDLVGAVEDAGYDAQPEANGLQR